MCSPGLFMMGASTLGTGISAYGAYQSSKGQQAAYTYNAQVGEVQAADAVSRGEREVVQHRMKVAQLKSQQRANLAANGVSLDEGSALDILSGTDALGDMDAGVIRQNAEREAWGYRTGAALNRYSASAQSPLLAGTSTLLSGAGTVAGQWYNAKSVGAL